MARKRKKSRAKKQTTEPEKRKDSTPATQTEDSTAAKQTDSASPAPPRKSTSATQTEDGRSRRRTIKMAVGTTGQKMLALIRKLEELREIRDDSEDGTEKMKMLQSAERLIDELLQSEMREPFLYSTKAQVLWDQGRLAEALRVIQHAISAEDSDNVESLSAAIHFAMVLGQEENIPDWTERLLARSSRDLFVLAKQLEGLSYLGNDQEVLRLFAVRKSACVATGDVEHDMSVILCLFYAGVAAARLRDDRLAWECLEAAQDIYPELSQLQENLDDLAEPSKLRQGGWPFSADDWLPMDLYQKELIQLKRDLDKSPEARMLKTLDQFLTRHPEWHSLIPVFLHRGAPAEREIAYKMAVALKTPASLDALEAFARDRFGTDDMRWETFGTLIEAGRLRQGEKITWWKNGELQTKHLFVFSLYDEPKKNSPYARYLSAQAAEIYNLGTELLALGDLEKAQKLLEKAYQIAPKHPGVIQNLAALHDRLGEREKTRELLTKAVSMHPDYIIGRAQLGHLAAMDKKFEEAWEWLEPTLHHINLHETEFVSVCEGMMEYWNQQGNKAEARAWYDIWKELLPEDLRLHAWKKRLNLWARIKSWLIWPFVLLFLLLYGIVVLIVGAGRLLIDLFKKI